jgi:DHA1 family multidrug resistance protein-like MFS transporter
MFIHLPFSYPRYAGSLFAANGLARWAFVAAAIRFAGPMFAKLDIDGGISCLTVLCIFGICVMYFGGVKLRKRSRFAGM